MHTYSSVLVFFRKKIWDYAGAERKGSFPGGPDAYREILYKRDDKNGAFSIRNEAYVAK